MTFWGASANVLRKEFWTNLRSVRMIILLVIFSLALISGAYGITLVSSVGTPRHTIEFLHGVLPQGDLTEKEILIFWMDGSGNSIPNALVRLWDDTNLPEWSDLDDLPTPNFSKRTNQTGFARFPDLLSSRWLLHTQVGGVSSFSRVQFGPVIPSDNLTTGSGMVTVDLDNDGLVDTAYLHLIDIRGHPAIGARISLNQGFLGRPDSRGLVTVGLGVGNNTIGVEYGGSTTEFLVQVTGEPLPRPFQRGSDEVLTFIALIFTPLLVPVLAIVVSYDAVAREKVTGSIDLLLSRPIRRLSIIVGKIMGVSAAILLPVLVIDLAGVGLISALSGIPPTPSVLIFFLVGSAFITVVFTLLQLTYSTLARTSGTALLFGILSWTLFAFLWGIIVSGLAATLLVRDPLALATGLALINPIGVFELLFLQGLAPGFSGSGFIPVNPLFIAPWVTWLAASIWIASLLGLALLAFQKRAAA